MSRTVYRFRLVAVCLALVALMFVQEPGRVAADTKLDLTVDPVAFLGRALHMWDASGFFGQVQNQAYGYLWPVGPFFAVLREAGMVPWVAQRLWWSVILVVAFLGFVLMARLLGVRSAFARVVAGLGYALSIRMVSELSTVSAEAWPMAVAPWLLIPLVIGSQHGSPRRWAALSGLAFLMTGSINAVASAAILPIGGIYLMTRTWGRRTWTLAAWWSLALLLASVWWLVPLLLLGRYSPPFLDWIEAAAVTTGQNDPTNVLRGAAQWVPYLVNPQGPVWPAGWMLVTRPALLVASGVVALLGVAGLLSRRLPERVFLVSLLCLGLVLTGLGHVGTSGVGALGAEQVRVLLDGPLAPLRNVHKFQPLVTLPLMVGLAHFAGLMRERMSVGGWTHSRPLAAAALVAAASAVAVAAAPLTMGQLIGQRSYSEIPGYWRETTQWLNERSTGRALVVPAASFGVYIWGRAQDEPLQALGAQSWAVRDAVPLSSAGNIRLLDEVERHLDSGTGSPGLAPALARSGVRWLVVRNDLNSRATGSSLPVLVHQALDNSPGIERVAVFGPILSSFDATDRTVDGGLRRAYPAVEVFGVQPDPRTTAGRVALRDASTVVHATGSTEALVDLEASALLGDGAAVLAGDEVPEASEASEVASDTFRRSEANFGAAKGQYSNTLTGDDPFRSSRPVHDYFPVEPTGRLSEARLLGAAAVTASSSGSSPFALRGRSQAAQPWAALDGDPLTAWVSGDFEPGVGQWWQIAFERPRTVSTLQVQVVRDARVGRPPQTLLVTTDSTTSEVAVDPSAEVQTVRLEAPQPATTLRIELASVQGGGQGQGFGLAEVRLPGVTVDRPLLMAPSAADGGIVLAARSMGRESCAAADTAVVCTPQLASTGEERAGIDRIIDVGAGGTYTVKARLRPRPGTALDAYLAAPADSVRVSASSQVASDPAVRGQAAADQLTRTTWIASPLDRTPSLEVELPRVQTVTGLVLQTAPDAPASRPLEVTVTTDGQSRTSYADREGRVELPAFSTDRLEVTFGTINPVRSIDSGTGASTLLPVGVTEMAVLGAPDARMYQPPGAEVLVPCGFGPRLLVDDEAPALTSVATTAGAIVDGALAEASGCDGADIVLSPGVHRLRMEPTAEWSIEEVFLTPAAQSLVPELPEAPRIQTWTTVHREVSIAPDPRPRLLETTENFNAGWTARLGDVELPSHRVDGWRQAFLVPAGAQGTAMLTYGPDRYYRGGLLLGLVAAIGLLGLIALPGRRSAVGTAGPARLPAVCVGAPVLAALLVGAGVGAATVGVVWLVAWVGRRSGGWPRAVRIARSLGLTGLIGALGLQAAFPWPGRVDMGTAYDLLMVIGPVLVLSALSVLAAALGGHDAGPASPGSASSQLR